MGEENSKFFHAMASDRLRCNSISSLQREDGSTIHDHAQMAGILWNSFKSRMGQAQGITMGFNLPSLLQPVGGPEDLVAPFLEDEIATVLKELRSDRADTSPTYL